MAEPLRIRQGTQAEVDSRSGTYAQGEPIYATDNERLGVGKSNGTLQRICDLRLWAAGVSVKVGDPVYKDGYLYICTEDHTTSNFESEATKWDMMGRSAPAVEGNIEDRDALTGIDLWQGRECYVVDASFSGPTPIISGLDVNTIAWQSGTTVRYTFNGTPDLSGVSVGNYIKIESSTKAANNGQFAITAVNDGSDYIEIGNLDVTDATSDEATDSPATGACADETKFDPTVSSGAAKYMYKTGTGWIKVTEYESLDVVIQDATENIKGIVKIATTAKIISGTDNTTVLSPLGFNTYRLQLAANTSKLGDIEENATADQTGAEIKTALFNEADTNNLTNTLKSKLDDIEVNAKDDQAANEVSFTPSGDVTSTNVQTAIQEVRDDTDTKLTGKENSFTKNSAFNKNFGAAADDTCRGNDSRLSDSRKGDNTFDNAATARGNLEVWSTDELSATGGSSDRVDWSQVKNVPNFGSESWLPPVANNTAKDAITGMSANDCVLVQDDGDGKAAQYSYNGAAWVKISDVDWSPMSDAEVKTAYENNAETNALTDAMATKVNNIDQVYSSAEKTKLGNVAENANNYVHPDTAGNKHIPSGGTVGQVLINTASGIGTWQDLPVSGMTLGTIDEVTAAGSSRII